MNEQTYCSPETSTLAKILIQIQQSLQPAIKDRLNSFTHSHYATLNSVMDTCRDALFEHGIWLTQYPVPAEPGHLGLVTKLVHAESGQWQSSHAVVPLPKNDPQGFGIAMTYTRRYSISALLGIVMEDDTDGNMVSEQGGGRSKKHPPAQRNATSVSAPPPVPRTAEMPKLDGVTYQEVTAQDGRLCIVAKGNTQVKKELLAGAGFTWNPQRKIWWKYAHAS